MSMNIERIEDGVHEETDQHKNLNLPLKMNSLKSFINKWWLLLINCGVLAIGSIGGPLLLRLYYLKGGKKKWLSGSIQAAGFPIILIPLSFIYLNQNRSSRKEFFASPKFLLCGAGIGIVGGLSNFMYSFGLSYLPVSTSSILLATQLAFTAFFALIIARHKFTPYSINAVVLMTLGSILLGLRKNGDRAPGVTSAQYLLGFLFTIGAACLLGFIFPCNEAAIIKTSKNTTYSTVLQYQFCSSLVAMLFCMTGMIVNKDFSAIPREAREFGLGEVRYYLVLASCALFWQCVLIGSIGIVFCASSVTAGILTSILLPMTEIAAVIVFDEKFNGEKAMALALSVWGFTSYFYGAYRDGKKQKREQNDSK